MKTQTITIAGSMTESVTTFDVSFDDESGFSFEQDYKLKTAFERPALPAVVPDGGQFWCVHCQDTGRLYGPYLTENAALSLIQEDGINGKISRMVLA